MIEVTVHQAKTHLSRLLAKVQSGHEVIVRKGAHPVARLVPYHPRSQARPRVGEITSKPVSYTPDCFAPLTDAERESWGMG